VSAGLGRFRAAERWRLGADLEALGVGIGAVKRCGQGVEDAPGRDYEALAGGERVARPFAARRSAAPVCPTPRGGGREALPFFRGGGVRVALLERGDASQIAIDVLGL